MFLAGIRQPAKLISAAGQMVVRRAAPPTPRFRHPESDFRRETGRDRDDFVSDRHQEGLLGLKKN
jgi:hypothetical protein